MNWETIFDHHINSSELENLYGFSDITKTEYLSDLKSINNAQDIAYGLISELYKLRGDNETALKQQKSGQRLEMVYFAQQRHPYLPITLKSK